MLLSTLKLFRKTKQPRNATWQMGLANEESAWCQMNVIVVNTKQRSDICKPNSCQSVAFKELYCDNIGMYHNVIHYIEEFYSFCITLLFWFDNWIMEQKCPWLEVLNSAHHREAADNCEGDRCVYKIVYKMKPAVFPLILRLPDTHH